MTERQFRRKLDEIINRHVKRLRRLRAIAEGAEPKVVPVKGHWVKRHWVDDYERYM